MEPKRYGPKQEVSWCKTIIKNSASNLRKQYERWRREVLILNSENQRGEEIQGTIPDILSENSLNEVEWNITLDQILSQQEKCVIAKLYMDNTSQRIAARACELSQPKVSRIKQGALKKLREGMIE